MGWREYCYKRSDGHHRLRHVGLWQFWSATIDRYSSHARHICGSARRSDPRPGRSLAVRRSDLLAPWAWIVEEGEGEERQLLRPSGAVHCETLEAGSPTGAGHLATGRQHRLLIPDQP